MADLIKLLEAKAVEKDSDTMLVSELNKKGWNFVKHDDIIMIESKDTQLFCIMDAVPADKDKVKMVHRVSSKGTRYSALVLA